MKAYDLKPTYDNLIKTFHNDVLGRNADIFRFTEILDAVEDSCSISLDGNWGSGKTFFVKQVKLVLDAHNSFIKRSEDAHTEEVITARKRYYRDMDGNVGVALLFHNVETCPHNSSTVFINAILLVGHDLHLVLAWRRMIRVMRPKATPFSSSMSRTWKLTVSSLLGICLVWNSFVFALTPI